MNTQRHPSRVRTVVIQVLIFISFFWGIPQSSPAYSVLTHEQLIDLAWKDSIRPLLLQRFPGTTEAELKEAHAYAYGGCAIQDMGYYPFGHEFFSDLTHYVRTGDFVDNLLRDSRNVDEYAFALGALSHYVGDNIGHQDAVNLSTPVEFPNLARKYGPVVTYDENPHAHVRTEFAFDIDQLSHQRLAPAAYLRHVGLKVPRTLLERAFFETYGLTLHSQLGNEKPALRSYRSSVRSFLPRFAYAETVIHRKDFPQDTPTPDFQEFKDRLAQADFENGWEQYRGNAGVRTYLLVFFVRIVPKVGPVSDLAIRGPNVQTEEKYILSVNRALDIYDGLLDQLKKNPKVTLTLPNRDLDTGYAVQPGGYRLTDATYAKLLQRITEHPTQHVPATLKQNILNYYANPNAPITTRKNAHAWERVLSELPILQGMQTTS